MNDYQRSLEGFNEPSITDERIEQAVEESSPVEGPEAGALHTERASDGEIEQSYEVAETQPVQQEQDPLEAKADRDFDLIEQAGNWIKTEVLGLDLDRRAAAESQDPTISEPAKQAIESERAEFQDNLGSKNPVVAAARNTSRIALSGVEKGIQDTVGAGNFIGDLAKTKLGMVEEDDEWNNVDHANYRGSERDLVMSEPRSAAGLFARDMVGFIGVAQGAKVVTGLGKLGQAASAMNGPQGMAARVAVETAAGAVADFLMDPGDGNAVNMLQELFPSLQDNEILSAFAHDDDDDEYSRRVKNMVEGGVMGNAVDATGKVMKGLLKGGKRITTWLKKNPGKKAVDAPQIVKDEAFEQLTLSLDDTLKEGQKGLDLEAAGYAERPGRKARIEEAKVNSGTKTRQDYEPYERASITTETPMGKVVADQAYDASRPMYAPGAPSPRLTDNTVRQIAEAGGDTEILEGAVKELEETFTPLLKSNDPARVKEAKERLAKLVEDNTGESVDMSALEEVVGSGADASAYVQSLLGNTVAKVYLKDLSSQMSIIGKQARQIADTGMDANKQYNLMLDRLKAAATIQIKDASRRGGALKTLQRNLTGGGDKAVAKKVDEFTTKVEDLRSRINEGDVNAVEEMQTLTDALVLSDGNAAVAESFWTRWASMTKEDFEITMFNSYLSGINTQQRNIMGNAANLLLKPVQMMMGASGENAGKMRQSSLAMYSGMWSDIQEGFQVARTALADNTPDSISKREAGNAMGQNMAEKIANLRQSAKSPAENAAANLKAAQYHLLANPWLQGATRLLDASDRGFRTLSARQKLRFDQNMLALDDGIKFDPKKYDTVWSTKFKNGEIADEQLLAWAKQDTFQEDLGKNMTMVADMINTIPGAKYIIPFVKTPTNIIKQTAHYVPLVGKAVTFTNSTLGTKFFKEFDEVMNGSDEAMKAVYRGREATGYMIAVTGMGLGSQGLITGQGPSDPQKRELWEAAGNQQHSINIGGQWVSTRFLGPLGILLSAYADLGTMAAQPGNYDTVEKLRSQLIYTTAGALTDQSFLKGLFTGLEGVMDSMSGNPKEQKPGKWQADLLRAMTPYSAALRALSNTLTPGMREYDTEYERYAAEIGLKGILDLGTEKISMRTGEPVVNAGYSALNQFVPFSLKEAREDPLLNKLVDLGVDMPMEMTQKYKGMKLTVEEQNKINAFVAKSPVWDLLEAEINSESFKAEVNFWQNGPQGDDKRDWKPIPREKAQWYVDIKADLTEARNDAIDALRAESVDFDTKITAIEDRDFHGRRGNYYAANDAQASIDALKTF